MKKLYLLFVFSSMLVSQASFGQSNLKQYLSIGVSQNALHIEAPGLYHIYGAFFSSTNTWSGVREGKGVGLSVGYATQLSYRFELALRANYTGNTVTELISRVRGDNANGDRYDYTLERARAYRAVWLESLVFWRVVGPRSRADIQLGAGLSYLGYQHEYESGFEFDVERGIYDVQTFTSERKGSIGLPIHAQIQFPVAARFKLGLDAFVNFYEHGRTATGLTLLGAYQLCK